jgi:TRAP transporter TAXI family solute receptor
MYSAKWRGKEKFFLFVLLTLLVWWAGGELTHGKEYKTIKIVTTSPGVPWYIVGAHLAEAIEKAFPGIKATAAGGGSGTNPVAVSEGKAELGWTVDASGEDAYHGRGDYKKPLKNLRLIGGFAVTPQQICVRADSDIKHVTDLKNKKIAIGKKGWGTTKLNLGLLDAFGITPESIKAAGGIVHFVGYEDWATMLQDKQIDGFLYWGGLPSPLTLNVIENPRIRILAFTDEEVKKILERPIFQQAYAFPMKVKKDFYPKVLKEDITSLAYVSIALTNEDLPKDLVYKITKLLFETKKITEVYQDGISFSMKLNEFVMKRSTIPLHPGAEQYFQEKGIRK